MTYVRAGDGGAATGAPPVPGLGLGLGGLTPFGTMGGSEIPSVGGVGATDPGQGLGTALPRRVQRKKDDFSLSKLWLVPRGDNPKWVFLQCDRTVQRHKVMQQ